MCHREPLTLTRRPPDPHKPPQIPTHPSHPRPKLKDLVTCTADCNTVYNPDDARPMHFFPKPACRRWFHRDCLEHTESHDAHGSVDTHAFNLLRSDPDSDDPFPLPLPSSRGKGNGTGAPWTLPAKLREAAAQQMLEGVPPYGLVGNAQPVAAARPATSARPGPRSTSGWSAWTAPTSRACSRTAGARRRPLGVRGLTAAARAPSFISWRFLVRCVEVPFDATYLCDSREGPFLVEFYLTISCMKSSYGGR